MAESYLEAIALVCAYTGCSMLDARNALTRNSVDVRAAVDWLRRQEEIARLVVELEPRPVEEIVREADAEFATWPKT